MSHWVRSGTLLGTQDTLRSKIHILTPRLCGVERKPSHLEAMEYLARGRMSPSFCYEANITLLYPILVVATTRPILM